MTLNQKLIRFVLTLSIINKKKTVTVVLSPVTVSLSLHKRLPTTKVVSNPHMGESLGQYSLTAAKTVPRTEKLSTAECQILLCEIYQCEQRQGMQQEWENKLCVLLSREFCHFKVKRPQAMPRKEFGC